MKKLFILCLCSLSYFLTYSQSNFGIKGGISTTSLNPGEIRILEPGGTDRLGIALNEVKLGVHAGILLQVRINKFILQPEVIFNSNSAEFTVSDLLTPEGQSQVMSEKYQFLDIPLLAGFKFGPIRLMGGPTAHVFVASKSDLEDLEGYTQSFESMTFGYQLGGGLDIWNLMLDFRYEGNFSNFGNHIVFDGQAYEFDSSASRFVVSVGFLFGKR